MTKQGARLWTRCTNAQHPLFSFPQLLASHPINHAVQLLLPGQDTQPPSNLCQDSCLVCGQLGDVVSLLISNGAWQHGGTPQAVSPVAVALGPQLCSTGGIAITDVGMLHLAVTSSTFQRLGLPGKRSHIQDGDFYHIAVDLTSKNCKPGQHYHTRIVKHLNEVVGKCCLAVALPGAPTPSATRPEGEGVAATGQPSAEEGVSHAMQVDKPDEPTTTPQQPSQPLTLSAFFAAPSTQCRTLPLQHASWQVPDVQIPQLRRAHMVTKRSGRLGHVPSSTAQQSTVSSQVQGGSISAQGGLGNGRSSHGGGGHGLQGGSAAGGSHQADCAELTLPQDGDMQPPGSDDQQATHEIDSAAQGGHSSGAGNASCDTALLIEWFGALCCQLPGNVANSLLPEALPRLPSCTCITVHQWKGMIHSNTVLQVVQHAAEQVQRGACPWAAVCVWGWEDSPVGWDGMEHAAGTAVGLSGDNTSHYLLLLLPNQDVMVIKAFGRADVPCKA